jgi:hypothetical protein
MAGMKKARLDFTKGWMMDESMMSAAPDLASDMLGETLGKDGPAVFDELLVLLADDDDVADDDVV